LRWRADLGDDLDGSEIELLRERTPEAGAGAGGPTHLDAVAGEFLRLARSSEADSSLATLLRQTSPNLAIAALARVLTRPQVEDSEAMIRLAALCAELVAKYGDEQDRVDQIGLEIGLIRRLHGADLADSAEMLRESISLDEARPLVEQLA